MRNSRTAEHSYAPIRSNASRLLPEGTAPATEGAGGTDVRRGHARTRAEVAPILHWVFCAFIVSVPFETVETGLPISPSRLVGYALLTVALLHRRVSFRRPPTAVLW